MTVFTAKNYYPTYLRWTHRLAPWAWIVVAVALLVAIIDIFVMEQIFQAEDPINGAESWWLFFTKTALLVGGICFVCMAGFSIIDRDPFDRNAFWTGVGTLLVSYACFALAHVTADPVTVSSPDVRIMRDGTIVYPGDFLPKRTAFRRESTLLTVTKEGFSLQMKRTGPVKRRYRLKASLKLHSKEFAALVKKLVQKDGLSEINDELRVELRAITRTILTKMVGEGTPIIVNGTLTPPEPWIRHLHVIEKVESLE